MHTQPQQIGFITGYFILKENSLNHILTDYHCTTTTKISFNNIFPKLKNLERIKESQF